NLVLVALFGITFVVCTWTGLIEPMVIRNPFGPDNVQYASFLSGDSAGYLELWLKLGALLNVGLAFFNLMPFPPLDGSRVIGWLLPRGLQYRWYALDRLGIFLILGLMYFGGGLEHVWRGVEWSYVNLGLAVDSIVDLVPHT